MEACQQQLIGVAPRCCLCLLQTAGGEDGGKKKKSRKDKRDKQQQEQQRGSRPKRQRQPAAAEPKATGDKRMRPSGPELPEDAYEETAEDKDFIDDAGEYSAAQARCTLTGVQRWPAHRWPLQRKCVQCLHQGRRKLHH